MRFGGGFVVAAAAVNVVTDWGKLNLILDVRDSDRGMIMELV
jgi:hypothetical protein